MSSVSVKGLIAGCVLVAVAAGATGFVVGGQPRAPKLDKPTQELCEATDKLIEDSLRRSAYVTAVGMFDDSAPRESNRQLRMVAAAGVIQNTLVQRQTLGCPAIKRTLDVGVFERLATKCAIALAGTKQNDEAKASCDWHAWQRSAE